jgi:hypothetical protein
MCAAGPRHSEFLMTRHACNAITLVRRHSRCDRRHHRSARRGPYDTLIGSALGGDTSQFFMGVWIVLLECSRGYDRPYSLNCRHLIAHVIPKWQGLRNSSLCLIAKQLSGWLSMSVCVFSATIVLAATFVSSRGREGDVALRLRRLRLS